VPTVTILGLKSREWRRLAVAAIAAAISVFVIWYPFGFALGGMIEEWDLLHLFLQKPDAWASFPGGVMSEAFSARPLQLTVFHLEHAIDPHSFLGFHLLLIASCLVRVIAGCGIGFWLFRDRGYAVLLGTLFLVFPADTQQISLRTVTISIASTMMLVAALLMLTALTRQKLLHQLLAVSAATIVSCIGTLIYEPVFSLYVLAPLLVAVRLQHAVSFARRRLVVWLIWSIGPLFNGAYLFYALVIQKSGYQTTVVHGDATSSVLHNIHYLLSSGAYRVLFDGWRESWTILIEEVGNRWLFAAGALVLVVCFAALTEVKSPQEKTRYLQRLVLVGLLLGAAGYFPFMVSEAHMVITQRTFISVAPGASIAFVAAVALLFRTMPRIGAAIGSLLVFAGFVSQLYQHDQYTRLYTSVVRPYMANVADRIDTEKQVHLIKDHSGLGGYLNGMYFTTVSNGPPVRIGDKAGAYFLCIDEPFEVTKPLNHCELDGSTWIVSNAGGVLLRLEKSSVDVITMDHRFDVNYRAKNSNWKDLGSLAPEQSLFNRRDSPDTYHCRADSDWGYTRFCRGEGWGGGVPRQVGFRHENSFALNAYEGTLLFDLVPAPDTYTLRLALLQPMSSTRSSTKIEINGKKVDVSVSRNLLSAVIPPGLLVSGLNEIAISNAVRTNGARISVTAVDLVPNSKLSDLPPTNIPQVTTDRWIGASGDEGYALLADGFSLPEPSGVWTDGETAIVKFRTSPGTNVHYLDLEGYPFLDDRRPSLDADVIVDQRPPVHLSFALPVKREVVTVPVEAKADGDNAGVVEVRILVRDPRQPSSGDRRNIGLFVERLRVR
jgi:hypothetical protein